MVGVGRTDKGKIILIRNREEYPPIRILAEIGLGRIKHFAHDNVRSPHQAYCFASPAIMPRGARQQIEHGWPRCIGDSAGHNGLMAGNFDVP